MSIPASPLASSPAVTATPQSWRATIAALGRSLLALVHVAVGPIALAVLLLVVVHLRQGSIWLRPESLLPLLMAWATGLLIVRFVDHPKPKVAVEREQWLAKHQISLVYGSLVVSSLLLAAALALDWGWLLGCSILAALATVVVSIGDAQLRRRMLAVWACLWLVVHATCAWQVPMTPETHLIVGLQERMVKVASTLLDQLAVWHVAIGSELRTLSGEFHVDRAAFGAASIGTVALLAAAWLFGQRRGWWWSTLVLLAACGWTVVLGIVQTVILARLLNSRWQGWIQHPWCDGLVGLTTLALVVWLTIGIDQWFMMIIPWWRDRNLHIFKKLKRAKALKAAVAPRDHNARVSSSNITRPLTSALYEWSPPRSTLLALIVLCCGQSAVGWWLLERASQAAQVIDPRALEADVLPARLEDWRRVAIAGGQRAGVLGRDWPLRRWTYRGMATSNDDRVLTLSVAAPTAWPCWTNLTAEGWALDGAAWVHSRSGDLAAIEYRARRPAWQQSTMLVRGFCDAAGNLLAWSEAAQPEIAGPEVSPAYAPGTVACIEVQITGIRPLDKATQRSARTLLTTLAHAVAGNEIPVGPDTATGGSP